MDTKRLAILRELADHGSIGAVADVMGVTPSAVSQQLKILEKEAGVPLIEPLGRGVGLTSAGRQLSGLARELAIELERLDATWRKYIEQPAGEVTMTLFPSAAEMLLPGVLTRIAEQPTVELVCTDMDPTNRYDVADLALQFDIVVADTPTRDRVWDERGLQTAALLTEPLDVAMPSGHRLASRRSVSPENLVGETWIGAPEGYPYDRVLQQLAQVAGSPAYVAQRFDDNSVTEALVAAGHGIAILPRYTTRDHGLDLVTRPLTGMRASRDITAVLRPDRLERPSVRLVLDALRKEAERVAVLHQQ